MIKSIVARGSRRVVLLVGTTATTITSAVYGSTQFSTALFGQAEGVKDPKEHRFITYNVLSSHLAAPGYFVYCNKEDLDPATRLARVEAKLASEVAKGSIIALQEVSHTWAGPLHAMFANHGYHFATGLYGSKFSNYMGVGLAWATDRYEAVDVDIKRVSDTVRWPRRARPSPVTEWLLAPWRWLFPAGKEPFDPFKVAESRNNQLVMVRLRDRHTGETFCVATYHMPCLFGSAAKRQTMVLHSSLIAQRLQQMSKGDPYILLGDFNFQPGQSAYNLLTEGALPETDSDFPPPREGVNVDINKLDAMQSAYHVVNGTEPSFTNHARNRNSDIFTETLDYIFLSKQWAVKQVDPTPARNTLGGPFPNATEPSDHIMLGAQATLP